MSTTSPAIPVASTFSVSASAGQAGASAVRRADPAAALEAKHEIHVLVQEIAQLAQSNLAPDDFYGAMLTRVVSAMSAVGGTVWTVGEEGRLRSAFQINVGQTGLDIPQHRSLHGKLLNKALAGGQAIVVPPKAAAGDDSAGNPSDLMLVLAPLVIDKQPQAIIEIFQRPGGGPAAQRGYLRFLTQMSDLACEYLKNRRLRQLEERESLWRQLEQFVQAIHGSLDVQATSYNLVNEGRRLIECDRVSLAIAYGRRCRIEAVSGLDSIDRRATEVKRLSRLAEAVLRTGEPLWYAGQASELPPQIDRPLQEYLDQSHARLVAVLPLAPGAPGGKWPLGALIIEQLRDARGSDALTTRSRLVAQHGGQALARAIDHSSLFLLPVWQLLSKATWLLRGRTMPKTLLPVAMLAGLVAALVGVQTDFEVAARGKLQPALRREVFAQIDGVVTSVPVRHGQEVARGTILAELNSTNLELELAALIGRQTTNQEQIAARQRALLDISSASGVRLSPAEEGRLSAELIELRQEAQNIERELALFHEKQQQLVVTAADAGQVITWKVQDLLLGRPVIRGQSLMTLANPAGPWELELYVPERRLKHIQAAEQPLAVAFTLTSHPGSQFHGRVVEIEQTAEVREDEGNTVLVRVAIDTADLPPLHDQTTVTAKLHCGRTSLGSAWFCDLIETVQSKVLFWLPTGGAE